MRRVAVGIAFAVVDVQADLRADLALFSRCAERREPVEEQVYRLRLEPVYYEVDKPCEVFVGERVAGRLRAMDVHQGGLRCFLGAVFGVACGRRLAGCTDEQALQRGWHDVGDAGFLAVDRDDLVGAEQHGKFFCQRHLEVGALQRVAVRHEERERRQVGAALVRLGGLRHDRQVIADPECRDVPFCALGSRNPRLFVELRARGRRIDAADADVAHGRFPVLGDRVVLDLHGILFGKRSRRSHDQAR